MSFFKAIPAYLLLALLLPACSNLLPSGQDLRSLNSLVGTTSPDFSLQDISNNTVNLYTETQTARGVVLYFTMWCSVCSSHADHLAINIAPNFSGIKYFLVDYVSGTVYDASVAASLTGYSATVFKVLADTNQQLVNHYHATMGSTVVIDSQNIIRMNEDYRDGSKLQQVLSSL